MKTHNAIDQAFEMISAITTNLREQARSVDEQIRLAKIEHLEKTFREQEEGLIECLDEIDQRLIALSVYIEECQRLHANLKELSEKISAAGGISPPMPEGVIGDTLPRILSQRIEHLKTQGKV